MSPDLNLAARFHAMADIRQIRDIFMFGVHNSPISRVIRFTVLSSNAMTGHKSVAPSSILNYINVYIALLDEN